MSGRSLVDASATVCSCLCVFQGIVNTRIWIEFDRGLARIAAEKSKRCRRPAGLTWRASRATFDNFASSSLVAFATSTVARHTSAATTAAQPCCLRTQSPITRQHTQVKGRLIISSWLPTKRSHQTQRSYTAHRTIPRAKVHEATNYRYRVYVRKLDEKVKIPALEEALREVFSEFGNIVEIVAKKSVKRKGQAFIVYDKVESAQEAIDELQGFELFGKQMQLDFAKTRSDKTVEREDGEAALEAHKKHRLAEKGTFASVDTKGSRMVTNMKHRAQASRRGCRGCEGHQAHPRG